MNGHLLRGMLVPHTPRFLDPAHAAPVFQPVINGLKALGVPNSRIKRESYG